MMSTLHMAVLCSNRLEAQKSLVVPVSPDVGNALADYILNVSITFRIYFTKGALTKAYT